MVLPFGAAQQQTGVEVYPLQVDVEHLDELVDIGLKSCFRTKGEPIELPYLLWQQPGRSFPDNHRHDPLMQADSMLKLGGANGRPCEVRGYCDHDGVRL